MFQQTNSTKQFTHAQVVNPSFQLLLKGAVIDELTGEPPVGEIKITSNLDTLLMATLGYNPILLKTEGLFCLAGESQKVMRILAAQSFPYILSVEMLGYLPATYTVAMPPTGEGAMNYAPTLPDIVILLQREAIRIQGYVVEPTPTQPRPIPIAGAHVNFVTDTSLTPQTAEYVVALRTKLHITHVSGTIVRQRVLLADNALYTLLAPATVGAQALLLKEDIGQKIQQHDVLQLGDERTREYVLVKDQPQRAEQGTLLQLTSPLLRPYAMAAPVQKCTLDATGTTTTLAQEAVRGDGVLRLKDPLQSPKRSLPNELAIDTIEIADADSTGTEYCVLGAITDETGYYHIDGVRRVKTVVIQANAQVFPKGAEPIRWSIDYGQSVNNVDFRLLR